MPIALFCFRFHKKSGNESEYRIDIGLAVEEGVSDEVACTCCNHKKTLPTGDLDLLAIAQNLASARAFCKLEYCLNEKFTPYCLDKSPIYPRSRDVSSLFFNHNLTFKEDKVQRTPKNNLFHLEIFRKTDKILF